MKTILFPTDFTSTAQNALGWAKVFARQYNATLVILHVYQPPLPDAALPTIGDLGVGIGPVATGDMERIGRENVDNVAAQLRHEGYTVAADWRMGAVEEQIVAAAEELHADLIVTGRGDLSGFFDRLVGSAATDVVRAAHCPVLVVPAPADDVPARPVHLQQILYATQLEFDERTMLSQVLDLARQFDAELSLVKVNAANQPDIHDDQHFLDQLRHHFGDLPFDVDKVKARTVTAGLTEYLEQHPADLLVMTTMERGFLAHLLNPSQAERMVIRSEIPMLVLHNEWGHA